MIILIKRKILETANTCLIQATEIKDNDCEPYLADAINKINWFKDLYMKV
jgi:hypothetical protein